MAVQRLKFPLRHFLVGMSIFLMQRVPKALSSEPGTPLSDQEYEVFFATLRPTWKANLVCLIRRSKGCQDPKIIQLDQYENHGEIPDGPICADLPDVKHFETFCLFAQFRCLNRKFYTKRIHCPEEPIDEELPLLEDMDIISPTATQSYDTTIPELSLPSSDDRLRSNIDAILKYSFAVSGQEPMLKDEYPAPEFNWEARVTTEETPLETLSMEPNLSDSEFLVPTPETFVPDTKDMKVKEGVTDEHLQKSIHHLIGMAFSLEKSLGAQNAGKGGQTDLGIQEAVSQNSGSFLAVDKDEALVILCYAMLQDICISSAVSKAWKQIESKATGFGDLVCDNLGRRHADLCSECAFCSLKTEQCQGASNLRRIPCDGTTFTTYINPGILAQHQAMDYTISPEINEYYGVETYAGLQAEYWCGRLATHGCDDYRVSLWLQTEYSFFRGGDFPDKICDSTGLEHPTYCAFKSHQCRTYSLNGEKVMRLGCLKNKTYRVLTKEEGEEEVLLWSQKFLTFPEG